MASSATSSPMAPPPPRSSSTLLLARDSPFIRPHHPLHCRRHTLPPHPLPPSLRDGHSPRAQRRPRPQLQPYLPWKPRRPSAESTPSSPARPPSSPPITRAMASPSSDARRPSPPLLQWTSSTAGGTPLPCHEAAIRSNRSLATGRRVAWRFPHLIPGLFSRPTPLTVATCLDPPPPNSLFLTDPPESLPIADDLSLSSSMADPPIPVNFAARRRITRLP